jgi:hypothetical protein
VILHVGLRFELTHIADGMARPLQTGGCNEG